VKSVIKIAKQAARIGGKVLLEHLGRVKEGEIEHKGRSDYVTRVDRRSEEAIISYLSAETPGFSVLAEESGPPQKVGDYVWVIDPLDGTTNYIQGFTMFAVSIALVRRTTRKDAPQIPGLGPVEVLLGVNFNPSNEEMYTAEKGRGAYLNGTRLRISQKSDFSLCLLATGFPFRAKDYIKPYLTCFEELFWAASGIRRTGSAALDLCYTASGVFDGFWELKLSPWDMAAGTLVIEEAGGVVTDFNGGKNHFSSGNIIAANPFIHKRMVEIIRKHFYHENRFVPVPGTTS